MSRSNFHILLVYPNLPMTLVTPLSIAVFTWTLREEGFKVELFDTTQYGDGNVISTQNRAKYLQANYEIFETKLNSLKNTNMETDFRKKIEEFGPDILLYSFTEDALRRALQLLRISNTYKIPTVVGGVLATAAPEWLISFPEISILGVSEGEKTVRDLALRLAKCEDITTIPNLWIKSADGLAQRNSIGPYINLDDYSTDFSLFEKERFLRPMGGKMHRTFPIETYRGCPYRCTFCNSPMHNHIAKKNNQVYLRRRTIEGVRKELKHLVDNYEVDLFYFIDDSFLARPKSEIEEFIEMYKEFSIPFWFNTRPENCSTEILKKLRGVGLFRVSFGIESGNEEFRRKRLSRNISNEKLLYYFDLIKESGISYSINCIIGFPYETREMIFDTIRLVKRIKGYDSITVSIFTPYRGTALRDQAINEGWLDNETLTIHTTATSILKMPHLTARQIDGLIRVFPLYVEFNESVWPQLEKAEFFEPEGEEILAQYSKIYKERRWKIIKKDFK